MFHNSPNDACILGCTRTPLMRLKRKPPLSKPKPGRRQPKPQYHKNFAGDMLEHVLIHSIHKSTQYEPDKASLLLDSIEDIVVGNCNSTTMQVTARLAQAKAWKHLHKLNPKPNTKRSKTTHLSSLYSPGVMAINRQCSSGLQAFADVANSIVSRTIECGIAAGVESMSVDRLDLVGIPSGIDSRREMAEKNNKVFEDISTPMGVTSEIVAKAHFVTRRELDEFAAESHRKAALARASGKFKNETTLFPDDYFSSRNIPQVSQDDGIREGTSVESLSHLRPSFSKFGVTTAGNSSQLTDGAAAAVVASRAFALSNNLPILAIYRGFACVGVHPRFMGIGPIYAIPRALEIAGITISDVDLFELNEAFASQAIVCVRELGLDMKKVNVNGGAIALGHPLGCTGMRALTTVISELQRRGGGIGVVSMCVGTGMGAACVVEVLGESNKKYNNIIRSKL